MAINFPNNPLDGNTYTYEGVKYTFKDTGSGGYWYLKDLGTATAATTADVNAGTDNTKYVTSDSLSGSTYDTRISSNASSITSLSNSKANTSGTYSGLRAQATTKADVGLSNVGNFTIATSLSTNSTSVYAMSNLTHYLWNLMPHKAAYNGLGQLGYLAYANSTGNAAGTTISINSTYSGSTLMPVGTRNNPDWTRPTGSIGTTSTRMSGTWRALGYAYTGDLYTPPCTLFVRIS
jgi:hypothetical protein